MADIKSELAAKRNKLEELKRRNQPAGPKNSPSRDTPPIVDPVIDAKKKPNEELSQKRFEVDSLLKDLNLPFVKGEADTPRTSISPSSLTHRHKPVCSITVLKGVNILPRDSVNYAKSTQTEFTGELRENEDGDSLPASPIRPETFNLEEGTNMDDEGTVKEEDKHTHASGALVNLTEEQKQAIVSSESFFTFFDWSTRVMERALGENNNRVDIFRDYAGKDQLDEDPIKDKVALNREFFDDHWSRNRVVTSMDWSTTYPELLLSSYFTNEEAPSEPDGVVCLWNYKYQRESPEYVFHWQSPVLTAKFAPFHPNLIIGGCYSGQIVMWDTRTHKRTPVQKTTFSTKAHVYPVYCLDVVGSKNAHNLISISKDGKICSWSLENLSQPQYHVGIDSKTGTQKPLYATCMSFPVNDVNRFYVGTDEKNAYQIVRHGNDQGTPVSYEGHSGPISGIDCHRVSSSQFDFSSLFLTSSADWSVKLWNASDADPNAGGKAALHTFAHSVDYVWGVQWSPVHPAVFASIDGGGNLYMWNINQDVEVPSTKEQVGTALNCLRFHPEGRQIAVGDEAGRIHVYNLSESHINPSADEWVKLQNILEDFESNDLAQTEDRIH
ncbi:Cytoplasmic dynein 1 intermediate chain 2-like isoform X19 [Oopsacas minuta]|uniref:Cytoplasmic dynein 1 intermediate chain 2-like isoform X19 n=1 Tax=Oopsacas minuta TaxID=111878 RepID=A0AAV7JSQ7_9METZ|nr:Cytoplasmic dynein 1 intermediate chain 2-like isoform X19 [Oopsacas minuta]